MLTDNSGLLLKLHFIGDNWPPKSLRAKLPSLLYCPFNVLIRNLISRNLFTGVQILRRVEADPEPVVVDNIELSDDDEGKFFFSFVASPKPRAKTYLKTTHCLRVNKMEKYRHAH